MLNTWFNKKEEFQDFDTYQCINFLRNFTNCGLGKGLVNISAVCSFVEICSIQIVLFITYDRKWWSLMDKCLVRGLVLWFVAIFRQLMLSSNVLHTIFGVNLCMVIPLASNSRNKWMTAITSLNAVDKAIYSASVVLRAMSDCNFDFHINGHPAYEIQYPDLE